MFKHSVWLEKYGLVPKVFLAVLLFICVGGLNFCISVKEVINYDISSKHSYNARFDTWQRPDSTYGASFDDWLNRKKAVTPEIKEMYEKAVAKGNNYSVYDYFQDYEQLLVLEDKYNMRLTGGGLGAPIEQFIVLRDRHGILNGKLEVTAEQLEYVKSIQAKIDIRSGMGRGSPPNFTWSSFVPFFYWLIRVYVSFAIFWFFVYLIRFQERKKAQKKVKRHIHNTDRFVDDVEDLPGILSLKDEIILCPWRFISRIVFWPFFCMQYPFFESPAEMMRFYGLRAEFLRYKPIGYQLSEKEEFLLRIRAKSRVKNFDKAIRSISELEIYPQTVRRSLAAAYLSLFLGVVLQPVIVFAAQYSDQVNKHFHSQTERLEVDNQLDHYSSGNDPPGFDFPDDHQQLALLIVINLSVLTAFVIYMKDYYKTKFKEFVGQIDYVPRLVVYSI